MSIRFRSPWLIAAIASFAAVSSWANEASLSISEPLREQPTRDAEVLTQLPARMHVEIQERRGGWVRIAVPGMEGWVRLISLRDLDGSTGPQYRAQYGYKPPEIVSVAGFRQPRSATAVMRVTTATSLCDLPEDCEDKLANLAPGTVVTFVLQEPPWLLVKTAQGQTLGWLPVASVCLVDTGKSDCSRSVALCPDRASELSPGTDTTLPATH
jgi:hypothetical protein